MNPIQIHRPGGGPPAPAPGRGGISSLTKKPGVGLAAAAAVIVVIVALARKSSGGAADPVAGASATGASAFDSTANDLYNSIQPEIDALAQRLTDMQNQQPTPATGPKPVTLPAPITLAPIGPPPQHTYSPVLPGKR